MGLSEMGQWMVESTGSPGATEFWPPGVGVTGRGIPHCAVHHHESVIHCHEPVIETPGRRHNCATMRALGGGVASQCGWP